MGWPKGKKPSPEHRKKISDKLKGRKISEETKMKISEQNTGKRRTTECKKRMSESHKGVELSSNHRANIGEALKGRKRKPETIEKVRKANTGKKRSEETKRKLSESHKGQNVVHSESTKEKIRQALKGRVLSSEFREKLSIARIKIIKEGKVDRMPRSKSGHFFSKKNDKLLHYRSLLELHWYQLLEKLSVVQKYSVEPVVIPYEFEGFTHRYLPDLRIRYMDGTMMLMEVKPECFWNTPMNLAKFKAARRWCKGRKIPTTFKVVGYEGLN